MRRAGLEGRSATSPRAKLPESLCLQLRVTGTGVPLLTAAKRVMSHVGDVSLRRRTAVARPGPVVCRRLRLDPDPALVSGRRPICPGPLER